MANVAYSYSIGNEFYAGEFQLRSSSERKATEKELRWKGQKIGVRYSPRSPKLSVGRTEDQAGLYGGEYAGDGFPGETRLFVCVLISPQPRKPPVGFVPLHPTLIPQRPR